MHKTSLGFFYDSDRFGQYLKLFHLEKDGNAPYNVRICMNLALDNEITHTTAAMMEEVSGNAKKWPNSDFSQSKLGDTVKAQVSKVLSFQHS